MHIQKNNNIHKNIKKKNIYTYIKTKYKIK